MLVVITGVIGAGKTSLVEGLAEKMGATPFYEPLPETDNFMLEAYYKDPSRYSYSMQTLLLALRFRAQQEAQWRSNRGELCVMDSSIYADQAFLEVQRECGYVDELEYRAYLKLCEIHFGFIQYPDLHLHLHLPLDTELERINTRSRDCESGIPVDYLNKLRNAYEDLIPSLALKYPVKIVDANQSKAGVLSDAIKAIQDRKAEMEREKALWPVYKKNTGYERIN